MPTKKVIASPTAPFFLALIAAILFPAIIQWIPLTFFAPFLVIAYYKCGYVKCLWLSLLCGLIIDLLSSHTTTAIHSINYCITTAILYNRTKFFFDDKIQRRDIRRNNDSGIIRFKPWQPMNRLKFIYRKFTGPLHLDKTCCHQ